MTAYPFSATIPYAPPQDKPLAAKDLEILILLSDGRELKEITSLVFLSKRSLNYRIAAMCNETGCSNSTQLVFYYRAEIEKEKFAQKRNAKLV